MADDSIEIEIVLDDGKIIKGFQKIEKKSKKTGSNIGSNLNKGLVALSGTVLAVGAAFASAFAGRKVIEAAQQQEVAINKLNIALSQSGKLAKGVSEDFQAFASELQKVTTIGDETTLETAALIQSLGQLEVSGLKRATIAAADLSAALGIDLKAAALLVGKAAAGEVSSFSRYGLVIKKGATEAETFERALTALEGKFGGSAQAQVNTFSGRLQQMSNAFGDLLEEIGFVITRSPALVSVFKVISDAILGASDQVKGFREDNKDPFSGLITGAITFGAVIATSVVAPIEVMSNVIQLAFNGINLIIQGTISSLADAASKIVSFFAPESDLAKNLNTFKESSSAVFDEFANDAGTSLDNVFKADMTEDITTFLAQLQGAVDQAKPITDQFATNTEASVEAMGKVFISVKQKTGLLQKSLVSGFTALGGALAQGKNGFEAFGKAVLGIIGDLAINIGSTLIGIGLGVEKLKASLTTLTGGFAIAAGLALVALGGALKSLGGGAGLGSAGASTSGDSVASGGEEILGDVDVDNDLESPGQNLVVNVEGTVLDPAGVGQQIVDVLNEAGFTNGSRVIA
jgi:hypothetical protein